MPARRPKPNPKLPPDGPCVALHRYRSALNHAVEVQILKTGDSFAVVHGAESTSSAPTRKDGFASLEEAARATGAFCLSPSRPDSEHSFESTHLTRDDLVKLIAAVQSRDRIAPTTFRFEVEGRPYVCTGGFECFQGTYEQFASFSG